VRVLSSVPFTLAAGATSGIVIEATGTGFGARSGAVYARTGNDTSLVAQSVGFKLDVAASAPAVSPAVSGLLAGLLVASAVVTLRRRSATRCRAAPFDVAGEPPAADSGVGTRLAPRPARRRGGSLG
jgi:hypothetical protein